MDPDKRATAREMLNHPWLDDVGEDVKEVRLHSVLVAKYTLNIPQEICSRVPFAVTWHARDLLRLLILRASCNLCRRNSLCHGLIAFVKQ